MFAELQDVKMYYEIQGEGEPVILIAGIGANHRFWKNVLPLLDGYKLITMDNRGVGETTYQGDIQIDILADDVVHLMDYLGIPKAHIIGWSMGSQVSQSLAIRYPERLQSLTLISTYPFRPHRTAYFMFGMAQAAVDGRCSMDQVNMVLNSFCYPETTYTELVKQGKTMPVPKRPEDPKEVLKQMLSMNNFDTTERAKEIKAPSLVIHGGADIMVEPILGRHIGHTIPDCTYMEVEGEGHILVPEKYIDAVREHLAKYRMESY